MSIGRDGNVLGGRHALLPRAGLHAGGKAAADLGRRERGSHSRASSDWSRSVAHDSAGNFYVSEYGEFDRIQKFTPEGKFLLQWGGHGSKPGQFIRPQKMTFDEHDHLWVTDACNHRIQVFDTAGKLLQVWGKEGSGPGELYYPYDLAWPRTIRSTSASSATIACRSSPGRAARWAASARKAAATDSSTIPGRWVRDSRGMVYVLDTNNHRVQVVKM